jgi:hypothetical protein
MAAWKAVLNKAGSRKPDGSLEEAICRKPEGSPLERLPLKAYDVT